MTSATAATAYMSRDEKERYLALLKTKNTRLRQSRINQFFPETGSLSRHNYPKHMQFFKVGKDYAERCIMAANRIGKALQHGTKIATEYGWKNIEDIALNDIVVAGDGTLTTVVGVYPQGEKQLYTITFNSGTKITCCGEHLWQYKIAGKTQVHNTHQLSILLNQGISITVPQWLHSGHCLIKQATTFNKSSTLKQASILKESLATSNDLINPHQPECLMAKLVDVAIVKIAPALVDNCTCIEVNHPEHTFIIAGGIVTHNSESIGAYEMTCHLTGRYPNWWEGFRFNRPVTAWAAGTTGTTARDIVQYKLIGPPEDFGTGLIPKRYIHKTTPKAGGVPNAVDTILVKHISGGLSKCKIKSYAEGRKSFEGTEQDVIWLDEECPMAIYTECVTRTMTTDGLIMLTFTPLEGLTDTVLQFMPHGNIQPGANGSKYLIMATWDDAPHLTTAQKEKLFAALPPHQRDARSKGIPQLGSGSIFPILESNIIVEDFPIPDHWLRCYALDVGWKKTACLWAATDPTSNITYLYNEYYQGQAEPIIHAEGIRARGIWIPGIIDSAAHGRSQEDGRQLFNIYMDLGLDISNANKSVEAGLYKVWQMLSTNRIKVFGTLVNWLTEFRMYRRDENGKIVKDNDHLMDCTRYLIMSGLDRAIPKPFWEHMAWEESEVFSELETNLITGY